MRSHPFLQLVESLHRRIALTSRHGRRLLFVVVDVNHLVGSFELLANLVL